MSTYALAELMLSRSREILRTMERTNSRLDCIT